MYPLTTTTRRLMAHHPCEDGIAKLSAHLGTTEPNDQPIGYDVLLDALGLDDALWCRNAEPQHGRIWRRYAVWCARQVQHLMTDERSLSALDVAERHANGEATDEQLAAAWAAARDAARDAMRDRQAAAFRQLVTTGILPD